jgi:hypothetical protein
VTGRQPYPWRVEDLLRWYAATGAALLGLAVAWWGVSGTAATGRAISWLDLGVVAVVVGGLGNMRWLLQGRRALAARHRAELPTAADLLLRRRPIAVGEARVAVPGTLRHHRASCAAVEGKPVEVLPPAEHEAAGRSVCGLCA